MSSVRNVACFSRAGLCSLQAHNYDGWTPRSWLFQVASGHAFCWKTEGLIQGRLERAPEPGAQGCRGVWSPRFQSCPRNPSGWRVIPQPTSWERGRKLDVFNVEQKEPDALILASSKPGKSNFCHGDAGSAVGGPGGGTGGPRGSANTVLNRALVPNHVYFMKIHGAPSSTSECFSVCMLTF